MLNKTITLYYNNDCENAKNACYPHKIKVNSENDLRTAVSHDHVCAKYKDNYRKRENFIQSDCTMMDIDNADSDQPSNWIHPSDIQEKFPNVRFFTATSRNHLKTKNGKMPRPKFHVYFCDKVYDNREEYENHKDKVCMYFSAFDRNAKDSARFFFGVKNTEIEFFDGELSLSEFMETVHINENSPQILTNLQNNNIIIPEGTRHSTLVKYAARTLTRWGESEKAYILFCKESAKCVPPLDEEELDCIWTDECEFYHEMIESNPDYIPPEVYDMISNEKTLKPNDYTDLGQTNVFAREHKNIIRFSNATGYLYYNGKIWVESRIKVHRLVQLQTASQLKEVSFLSAQAHQEENNAILNDNHSDKETAKNKIKILESYRKFVLKQRNTSHINAVLTELQPMVEIDMEKLDKDGFLLNTPDSTIDLKTGIQHPHSSLDYCTKITTVNPDLHGMELFQDFLELITCNDKALKDYLQHIAGMCLVGKVYSENLIIAYGGGKNGKSTFFNLLSMVLGNYSGNISAEILTKNSRTNKKNELAELRGKRLIIASELEDGKQLDTSTLKQLCSTDMIYAEKKYKAPFSFTPTHTTILCTNHLPSVEAFDNGTWRRLVVVPFQAVIEDNKEIKNYAEYLFQNSGGAILSWMIEGARQFIEMEYKISQPKVVKQAIETYRKENNWIQNYLSECCEIGQGYVEKAGKLYSNYRDYCMNLGEPPKSIAIFKKAITTAGYIHKQNAKGSFYYGLRLKNTHNPCIIFSMVEDGKEIEKLSENILEF